MFCHFSSLLSPTLRSDTRSEVSDTRTGTTKHVAPGPKRQICLYIRTPAPLGVLLLGRVGTITNEDRLS